jgi:hypothetical protein
MESATSEGKTKPLDKAVLDRINPVTSSLWLHFNEHYLNVLVLEKSGQELIFETGFSDIWNQNPGTILAEISQQAPVLKEKFSTSGAIFTGAFDSLIPDNLISGGDAGVLQNFLSENKNTEAPKEGLGIPQLGARVIFSPPLHAKALKEAFYLPGGINHSSQFSIPFGLQHNKNSQSKKVICFIYPGWVEIMAFNGSKLQLYNGFGFQTETDCLYFIMGSFDALGFNPENTPLELAGGSAMAPEIKKSLEKYVRYISFIPLPGTLKKGAVQNDLKESEKGVFLIHSQCA